ncbi:MULTISPECIES: nuclease-related domain-containing protein [unclassified Bacillus (in: firmicutes)]|uniref:nuclease-related domain-containing protein n=1 Tax=unclassified Bacillus (in: firmicutes) TaxID=185979 RepID=UPI001BEC84C0|nr:MULTISPECIES: nuclease-related domain-containing protein [unclassified Bacillus (in: firmicutes)]MBT2639213.1 NERD domain-containing protein [Bacillus sp. ISL-39]MBT2659857.1 NERD domain-containing protein [Bacillus sp. ISL-45]
MFYKDRDIPYKLKAEEALIRRLDVNHPKLPLIEEEYRKKLAGLRGEKELEYHLSFLKDNNYLIINDLRLQHGVHFFQIDSLLLSPSVSFIIDSKNIAGTIVFDHEFNQCIRIFNEKEEGIRDPFTQVQRHVRLLSQWLDDHNLPSLNLEYLIAISRPSTIIKSKGNNSYNNFRVVQAGHLIARIIDLEKRYLKEITTIKETKRIAKQLVKYHVPFKPNIFDTYSIHPDDVRKGVQCPECKAISMHKIHGSWYCPVCQTSSKTAHILALSDYYFLYGNTITLSQFSDFLLIPISKRKSASSFLISLSLPCAGSKKGRVYDLTPLIEK